GAPAVAIRRVAMSRAWVALAEQDPPGSEDAAGHVIARSVADGKKPHERGGKRPTAAERVQDRGDLTGGLATRGMAKQRRRERGGASRCIDEHSGRDRVPDHRNRRLQATVRARRVHSTRPVKVVEADKQTGE